MQPHFFQDRLSSITMLWHDYSLHALLLIVSACAGPTFTGPTITGTIFTNPAFTHFELTDDLLALSRLI
jgi:hypothetical protein